MAGGRAEFDAARARTGRILVRMNDENYSMVTEAP